mmetsp:Transcript_76373/g.163787  ORF Transcript_76373/g.163787 Transcript_76373/m.163787 type:complete len:284 (+) Transcript_76373:646-1497(+)
MLGIFCQIKHLALVFKDVEEASWFRRRGASQRRVQARRPTTQLAGVKKLSFVGDKSPVFQSPCLCKAGRLQLISISAVRSGWPRDLRHTLFAHDNLPRPIDETTHMFARFFDHSTHVDRGSWTSINDSTDVGPHVHGVSLLDTIWYRLGVQRPSIHIRECHPRPRDRRMTCQCSKRSPPVTHVYQTVQFPATHAAGKIAAGHKGRDPDAPLQVSTFASTEREIRLMRARTTIITGEKQKGIVPHVMLLQCDRKVVNCIIDCTDHRICIAPIKPGAAVIHVQEL